MKMALNRRFGFPKLWFAVAACAVCAIADHVSLSAQESGSRIRHLSWDVDQTIPNRLLPDDDIVVIHRHLDAVEPPLRWSWKQVVDDAATRADIVVVMDADTVDSVLAERGTWVNTRLQGAVREVLIHSVPWHTKTGERLEAQISGGELLIGRVRVKAGDTTEVTKLTANRPYLLFLKAYDGILYPTHTPLLIESGKLVYPWRNEVPNQHVNPLEGHTLTEVAKQVRQIRGSR